MKKTLTVLLLVSAFFVNTLTVFATYTAGTTTYDINVLNPIETSNGVEETDAGYKIPAGASIKYGATVPFDFSGITLKYVAASDTTAEITVDDVTYTSELSSDETATTISFENKYYGDHEFSISFKNQVEITGITINKAEAYIVNDRITTRYLPDLTVFSGYKSHRKP